MSWSFKNKIAVRKDLAEAVRYYKRINAELAKQFLIRVKEAKVHIERSPFGFQLKYKEVRTLLLRQFPY